MKQFKKFATILWVVTLVACEESRRVPEADNTRLDARSVPVLPTSLRKDGEPYEYVGASMLPWVADRFLLQFAPRGADGFYCRYESWVGTSRLDAYNIEYEVDQQGRVRTAQIKEAAPPVPKPQYELSWNSSGLMAGSKGPNGARQLEYDQETRIVEYSANYVNGRSIECNVADGTWRCDGNAPVVQVVQKGDVVTVRYGDPTTKRWDLDIRGKRIVSRRTSISNEEFLDHETAIRILENPIYAKHQEANVRLEVVLQEGKFDENEPIETSSVNKYFMLDHPRCESFVKAYGG